MTQKAGLLISSIILNDQDFHFIQHTAPYAACIALISGGKKALKATKQNADQMCKVYLRWGQKQLKLPHWEMTSTTSLNRPIRYTEQYSTLSLRLTTLWLIHWSLSISNFNLQNRTELNLTEHHCAQFIHQLEKRIWILKLLLFILFFHNLLNNTYKFLVVLKVYQVGQDVIWLVSQYERHPGSPEVNI